MDKYIQYVQEFQEWNSKWIEFINNQLKKHLLTETENQTEIETILDYLYSNQDVDISKIWYKTVLWKTNKRHLKLSKLSSKNEEIEWVDYDVVLDFLIDIGSYN